MTSSEQTLFITTPHLRLRARTREEAERAMDVLPPEERAQVSPDWLKRLKVSGERNLWVHGFDIVENASGQVVGGCGYKGPPDADGMVEIAYGINQDSRCKGYATEAAQAITRYALEQSSVRTVRAHTAPEPNASTRVLTKSGFRKTGEVIEPEDGLVWRWEIQRAC